MVQNILFSLITSLFFLAAIFFSYKLAKESRGEKYWLFFALAAVMLSLPHFLKLEFFKNFFSEPFLAFFKESGELIGAFSFAYASYGLYSSMKKSGLGVNEINFILLE